VSNSPTIRPRELGRVLVTGAAGFLGTALVAALRQQGADVVATDIEGDGVIALDLRDRPAVQEAIAAARVATVFHCGAVSGPMVMADRPREIWAINADGTANVLEAARRAKVGRVIVCSTVDVYGAATSGIATETTLLQPDTVYGASKAAAEHAALAYWREHGLDTLALRLSWIYGPGRKTPTILAALLRDSLTGAVRTVAGHPADWTHYLYIGDAVDALLRAAAVPRLGATRIFNITAGAGRPLSAVLDQVRAVAPKVQIDFRLQPGTNGPAGFAQNLADSVLGFRAAIPFEEGLRRTLAALAKDEPAITKA
jgi:nucleoside-diphosphate-sugar epimerase